jgi:hypothetical protein
MLSPEGKFYYRDAEGGGRFTSKTSALTARKRNAIGQVFEARTTVASDDVLRTSIKGSYTSLVDAAFRRVGEGVTARIMTFIRRGSGADIDSTDPSVEAKSRE